jgi:hypothetical protein
MRKPLLAGVAIFLVLLGIMVPLLLPSGGAPAPGQAQGLMPGRTTWRRPVEPEAGTGT